MTEIYHKDIDHKEDVDIDIDHYMGDINEDLYCESNGDWVTGK